MGHYGICMKSVCPSLNDLACLGSAFSEKLKVVRSPLMIFWGQNWSHQCSPLPEGQQKLPPEGASPQSHHAPLDLHKGEECIHSVCTWRKQQLHEQHAHALEDTS